MDAREIDELERALNKPLFVLKMARSDKRKGTSAITRASNARKTIHGLILNYANRGRTIAVGRSKGWFLICPFCNTHKAINAEHCHNCGATVEVLWTKQ